jgi:osmotically-inducible protein OsmY
VRKLLKVLPAALAAVSLTACSVSEKQDLQRRADDALIAAQVRTKIAAVDPATLSLVHVSSQQGVVTLDGDVPTAAESAKVVEAAARVGGVKRVVSRLRVNPKAPTGVEIARDLALETRVKTAIARDAGVNALRVRVSAHKGVVELKGTLASRALRAVVIGSARSVPGVKQLIATLSVAK